MAPEPSLDKNRGNKDRDLSRDEIEIVINGVTMRVRRQTSLPWPHEVTAVIPRAELRQRRYQDGQLVSEDELILNSITIVHAPRHPLAGEKPPAPALPGSPGGSLPSPGPGPGSGPGPGPRTKPGPGPGPGPKPASAAPVEPRPTPAPRYRITLPCPSHPRQRPKAPDT